MSLEPGMYVTLDSRTKKGRRFDGGRHRAMLVAIVGETAIVKPFGHGHTEEIALSMCQPWVAGEGSRRPKIQHIPRLMPVMPPARKLVKVPAIGGL